jgi:serine/threonine-protein kinase
VIIVTPYDNLRDRIFWIFRNEEVDTFNIRMSSPRNQPTEFGWLIVEASNVEVPGLAGLPEAEAIAAISQAGLVPGAVSEALSDTVPAGSTISSDPAAGASVEVGSSVAYVVSLGPEPVAVPDLVDLREPDAIEALTAAGLVPGAVSEAFSDTVPAGSVVSQDPAADAELLPGSAVAYALSLGSDAEAESAETSG